MHVFFYSCNDHIGFTGWNVSHLRQGQTVVMSRYIGMGLYKLKLPSLFAAWLYSTFHTKSKNMKALVILYHSWSPFLSLTCLYEEKKNFCWSLCGHLEYFSQKKLFPDHPCISHDHDHQWAALVMAWLL